MIDLNQRINAWLEEHGQHLPKAVADKWVAIARAYRNPTMANLLAAVNDDKQKAQRQVLAAAKALIKRICPVK
ncbi:MAG: hypothetical protein K8U57_35800 [Planctomycetes bacterium]|nr:hypothetical protein [Planctomycetota bacterium]